ADLVDLVDEYDAILLAGGERARLDLFVVDQARGLFLDQDRPRRLDGQLAPLRLLARQRGEHAAQLLRHFLHAGRRHDLDAEIHLRLDLDFALVQRAFAQLFAQLLARLGIARLGRLRLADEAQMLARRRQQGFEQAVFRAVFGLRAHLRLGLFAR